MPLDRRSEPLRDWLPEDDNGRCHLPSCEIGDCDGRCVPPVHALCGRRHWNACPTLWGGATTWEMGFDE